MHARFETMQYTSFHARRKSDRTNLLILGSVVVNVILLGSFVSMRGENELSMGAIAGRSRAGRVACHSQVVDKPHVTTKSKQIFDEAKSLMPGGVSSPVRAFKSVGGEPIVFEKVKGLVIVRENHG